MPTAPLAVPIKGGGIAVIFRYGAVVLFDGHKTAAQQFLATLDPLVTENSPLPSAKSCSF